MVFSSLLFLFRFLPAVLILYYAAPRKLRNVILLLFSLFFYAWGEPKYVFLMLFTITLDFFIGRGIDRAKKAGNQKKAKGFLLVSIITDLSILGFFKYADFLIGTVNTLTGAGIPLLGIPLPIGISFFTFQTMSYTIDVYKGSTEVQKNWIKYGTYVSMFPQLIAGPIVQYKTIAKQMEVRRENTDDFASVLCGMRSRCFRCQDWQWGRHGLEHLPIHSRYILILPAILIWRSDLERCLDSISLRTSITHTFQRVSQSSGDAGIFHLVPGLKNMSIFRWAETAAGSQSRSATFWLSGC